jgi:putative ABC transport system permease protein
LGEVNSKEIGFAISWIDENYLPALQIPLVAGRNFSKDFPADAAQSILVNESFVREAGWQEPIGKTVFNVNGNQKNMTVIGVVKDHHYVSLKEKIGPQLFQLGAGDLWIKLQPDRIPQALQAIEKTYRHLLPLRPYEYAFLDSIHAQYYEEEAKWKQIITVGAVLTVFISCIGLFGLATLSMIQRNKEIGIRKVFGASAAQIVSLVSQDFIKLVCLAFLLAVPVAWYAIHVWLENFAYRVTISWEIFAFAGILALLIALLTISFQSIKAALANPVKVLRSE